MIKRACFANTNRYEDLSCGFPLNRRAGYPPSEINYLQMKNSKSKQFCETQR